MMYGFWHTYNRGVDKRNIFLSEGDFWRGIHSLYEFNNADAVVNILRRLPKENFEGNPTSFTSSFNFIGEKKRSLLIDLFVWCFMNNHYHFFSSPKEKDNLSKFHQKFGVGHTNYFNLKHQREGVLFQGKYKKVQIKNDIQLGHLVCYIHANPLDLWKPNWKEKGINESEITNALDFLLHPKNRWSSHQDYWGVKNFPSLINTAFLLDFFGGQAGYQKFFIDWLKQYQKKSQILTGLTFEK